MKHIWSVLCLNSIVDVDTNLLTLQNCVDTLNVSKNLISGDGKKRLIRTNFELVHLLFDENINKDRRVDIKIELYDSNNEKIGEFSKEFIFPKQKKMFRIRTKMNDIPITIEGDYIFKIKMKEKETYTTVAELPFNVKLI